jgi:AcrR family transcriptional regulator
MNISITKDLLHQAEKLFSTEGYLATSLDDIASAMDIDIDALGVQKEDLLWASATKIADAFHAALDEVLAVQRPIDDRLRFAMMAHINVIVENLAAANVYMHEWRYLSPERKNVYKQRRDAYEEQFREIVKEGIYAGIFAPVDEKFATLLMLSALNWVSQWYREDGPMAASDIGHTLTDLTLNGLYRRV